MSLPLGRDMGLGPCWGVSWARREGYSESLFDSSRPEEAESVAGDVLEMHRRATAKVAAVTGRSTPH